MSDLELADNLADIQGNILRGYHMHCERNLALRIDEARCGRQLIKEMIRGDGASIPQVTTARIWTKKPDYVTNVAFTFAGLQALGLPAEALQTFPSSFQSGAAGRAAAVGYTEQSAPDQWVEGLAASSTAAPQVHMLISIYAQSCPILDEATERLRAAFRALGGLTELSTQAGEELPDSRVHFGYVDGLSQPHVEGVACPMHAGKQDIVPPGAFVLGYDSQFPQYRFPVPQPDALGRNGAYFAYLILRQDVVGFETFLETAGQKYGMDKELVAAKLCGRWRNGVPLSLSPDTDSPNPPIPAEELNHFDYVPTEALPNAANDAVGYRCPISSHIRRTNPRNAPASGTPSLRRIIRRATPYGPLYTHRPGAVDDGQERGLLLKVMCASLEQQFEFIMTEWVNGTTFTGGVSGKDPVIGSNDNESGQFQIRISRGKAVTLDGFSRFVQVKGAAYCFMPGITGLKYLACLD
jgi:deferrochelatase/peroxidase EfeB